jgi:UDP-N-acetylmuramoylalanine--D-glutamate ligase
VVGEAAAAIEDSIGAAAAGAGVQLSPAASLGEAVRLAAGAATAGQVVLLAPACASFDSYENFEQRGDDFRALVRELS